MFKFPNQKKASAIIPLAVLAGTIIGSAVGLLLAPQKGSNLRGGLKKEAQKLGSGLIPNGPGFRIYSKATMHAVKVDAKDYGLSKAAAMVSHLKQNKQDGNQFPNPL